MTDFDFDIPAAGEPLKPEVHPLNQALLDEELTRRLEMARAKLTRVQKARLEWEYSRLHRQLNRGKYNPLIIERAELLEVFIQLKAAYRAKPTPARKKKLVEIQKRAKAIDTALSRLEPVLKAFEEVKKRLETHAQVLDFEREEKENRAAFFREASVWEAQIMGVFKQSPRLHHITRDSKGRENIKTPVIDHIFLKADKIYFRVKTSRQNILQKFMQLWSSALPYGVDVPDLISDVTLANLTAACGRVISVERGSRSQNVYYVIHRMDAADGIPKKVRIDQVADYYPTEKHTATPWAAGLAQERKVIHFDFETFPHVLIAGSSGGGKSNLINALLAQIITMNSPEEMRLLLIDNKGGVELSHFDGIPHLLTPPVITVDRVLPALRLVRKIMTQRFEMFLKVRARSLLKYNDKVKNPLPRLIVVVDEMASLLGIDETPEIHNELRVITSQGRATGVHMVVSTQHPSVDVLPGWIKTNLTLRIASRMPNHTASQIVVDSISAAILPENPGRMVFRRGGFEQILQTPFIDDEAIARAVKIANQYPIASWQINAAPAEPPRDESDTDEYVPMLDPLAEEVTEAVNEPRRDVPPIAEPQPRLLFGRDEYLNAALQLGGSLSPTKIYEQVAKKYMTQAEARKFGDDLVAQLARDGEVWIDGIRYLVKPLARGYKLEEFVDQFVEEMSHDTAALA